MGRKRQLGKLPDLNDVRSAMTNAVSHFNLNGADIDKMSKAVKRLYEKAALLSRHQTITPINLASRKG